MSDNFAVNAFNNYGIWGSESQELASTEKDPLKIIEPTKKEEPEIKQVEDVIPVNPLDHSDPRTKEVASVGLSLDGSTDIQNRNIPAINSDDAFNLALDDYMRMTNSGEADNSHLAKSIKNYRGARFFNDGVDPILSAEDKEKSEKMNYVADLRRDWNLDPEARKRVEQKKGKGWADWYEKMDEDDKALIGSTELMKSLYDGDKDNFGFARYMKENNMALIDATEKGIWNHFGGKVALADKGRVEEKVRSDKALKLLPQVSFSLFNGERLHDVIKTMDKDDALWYMENFGVGSRGAVGMEKAAVALNALLGGEDDRVYMSVSGGITSQEEGFLTKRLFGGDKKKNNIGKIASFVEGQEALGDPEIGPKGLDRLVSLKKESPDAYNILISTIQITADDIRNNRWDYVPGVSPASAMFFQKSNQSANWIARNISGREISKDQADVIDDITIASDITKSRDGAWGVTKMIDSLGGIAGTSASYMLNRGFGTAITFSSIANDEYLRLKREGNSEVYAQWHSLPAATVEAAVEGAAFGKWGQILAGTKIFNALPLAGRIAGTMSKGAGVVSSVESKIASSTATRYLYSTAVGGTGEYLEEVVAPPLTYAVDKAFSLACLDMDRGMTLSDIKTQWGQLLNPQTAATMYLFAGMMSGAYIPAMRQDAKFLSQMPDWLQAAGVPEAKAKEIANITDFRERMEVGRGAIREGFANRSKEESLRSIAEAAERLNMADPLRPDMTEVEGLMQAGKIDRMTRTEDGMWEVQPRDGREAYALNEKQAAAYLTTQVADEDAISIVEARSLALKNALVSEMEESGKFIFEKMATPGETIETLKGLAKAAGIRMEELRGQGVANPEAQIDPSISENIPLGQIKNIRETLKDRKVIAESRGEIEAGEEGVSNAYRVRLNSAKTVIRFAEGRMNFSELLEEYYESKVSDSLNGTRTAQWWGTNLRESQKALRDMGILDADFIKVDGELSRLDILEGASFLGRAVAMNEAQKSTLPEGVRDFLRMLAAWTREALGLARLGKGFEIAAQKGHINKDFAREVYGLVGIQSEYWGEVAERAETQTIESANEAAFEVSASMTGNNKGSLQKNENETEYKRNGAFISREVQQDLSGEERSDAQQEDRDRGADTGLGTEVQQGESNGGARQSGENVRGAGGLLSSGRSLRNLAKREHSLAPEAKEKAASLGFYVGEIYELASGKDSAEAFRQAILETKQSRGVFGDCVYAYEAEEYANMRLFLTPDGMAGIALKPDGDMVSVFSHAKQKNSVEGKTAHSLIALAVSEGTTKADCYGWFLVQLYGKLGFREVAKDSFNSEYATKDMQNEETMLQNFPDEEGKPDVVYLVYQGNRANVLDEFNTEYLPSYQSDLEHTDYDTCVEIQSKAVEEQSQEFDVSFSIVGERAANWKKIKHNAFEGIHDGKPRVELDASKAAVKMHKSGVDMVTYYESTIKRDRTADNSKYLNTLGRILEFDELYKSYPWLRDVRVYGIRDKNQDTIGFVDNYGNENIGDITLNFANSRGDNPFQSEAFNGDAKRFLLHEIQHIIQLEEGFEYGQGKDYWERPGELESRNVERRSEFSEETRNIHPFNETLGLDASFSLGGNAETLDSFMVRRSKNKAQQAFYDSLRKDLQSVLDDARTISATKESNAELISKIHKSLGVVRAATANMPDGVRHSIRPTVVKLEMLAEMAATGKISATKHLNDASRRKLVNEMIESIDQEMTQLKQEAALDIKAAHDERLAEKKGELNEKTEALYKSLDYLDRTAVKKAYNERNKRIISIRKRYKDEDYIARRIEKENAKLDQGMAKYQTREEKLTSQITKLETRINSLKAGNVTNKQIKEAISEQAEEVRKAWADEKADALLAEMLSEIADKVTAHHKKQRIQSIRDLAKAVKTKKTASGKTKKGMMSADSFRRLHELIVPLFDEGETDLAGRRGKIEEEIKNLVDNEGTSTEEGLEQIAKKMAEMTTIAVFGNLKGKTLDQIEVAHDQLDAFIRREKSSWEAVMDERAQKRKVVGDKMIEALPTRAKQDTTHKAKIDNRRLKDWGDAATIFQSVPQMLDTLAKYKGLEEFAHDMRVKLGRAFDLMQSSDKARQRRMDQAIATITGEKSILKRNRFYKDWIKQTQTKIWIQPTETIKKTISVDEARLLASASKSVANKQESYSDNEAKLIAESLEQWEISEKERKEANEKDKKGRVGKRTIDIEYTIDKGEGNFLYMSKDNALNVIMLAEQESYRDLAERKGYKEGVLNQLRGWIGSQGLALKEVVLSEYKLQGDTLAKEYERSMGVPFPRNGNYSPGSFYAFDKMSDEDATAILSGMNNPAGGKDGFLRQRVDHNREIDTTVGALGSLWRNAEIVDNWIYTHEIINDFRGILGRKETSQALITNIGRNNFATLKKWVGLIERAGIAQAETLGTAEKLTNRFFSTAAMGILSFRPETLIRQVDAVTNCYVGDPTVSWWEYMKELAHIKSGNSGMSWQKMANDPLIQDRTSGAEEVAKIASTREDGNAFNAFDAFVATGMNAMGTVDAYCNAIGATALYNIYYKRGQKQGLSHDECDVLAYNAVAEAIEKAAQPLAYANKSYLGVTQKGFGRSILFMGSENFNKFGQFINIGKQIRLEFKNGNSSEAWGLVRGGGMRWIIKGGLYTLLGTIISLMRDEDAIEKLEESDFGDLLASVMLGPLNGIPVAGEVLAYALSSASKAAGGKGLYIPTFGRSIVDLKSAFRGAGKMLNDDAEDIDRLKGFILFSQTAGIAGAGILGGKAGSILLAAAAASNVARTGANVVDKVDD